VSNFRLLLPAREMLVGLLGVGLLGASLFHSWSCGGRTRSTVVASQHTVTLSWTASTTAGVEYDIYRAPYTTACGPFSRINAIPNSGTSYKDSSVMNGARYCYGVKAVDANNHESDYSNIVTNVQIPAE